MNELKTLKDIDLSSDGCNCEYRIRQEIINWVKDFKIKDKYPCIDVEKFLIYFFNIKEEELK